MLTRRFFLKSSGLALVSFGVAPRALVRSVYAADGGAGGRRRWWSSSSAAPATGSTRWCPTARRPTAAAAHDRDPRAARAAAATRPSTSTAIFGLHPALEPLLPLGRTDSLAVVHAVGSPDPTRSHFDAQDFMESGTPGAKSTEDGWMNRHLQCAARPRRPRPSAACR